MVEFGHSGSVIVRGERAARRGPSLRLVRSAAAEEHLLELAAGYQQLHGGGLTDSEAFARAGRGYVVVLVASLLLWLLIALAIFELVAAAS
jgi:hypothetical protein